MRAPGRVARAERAQLDDQHIAAYTAMLVVRIALRACGSSSHRAVAADAKGLQVRPV